MLSKSYPGEHPWEDHHQQPASNPNTDFNPKGKHVPASSSTSNLLMEQKEKSQVLHSKRLRNRHYFGSSQLRLLQTSSLFKYSIDLSWTNSAAVTQEELNIPAAAIKRQKKQINHKVKQLISVSVLLDRLLHQLMCSVTIALIVKKKKRTKKVKKACRQLGFLINLLKRSIILGPPHRSGWVDFNVDYASVKVQA